MLHHLFSNMQKKKQHIETHVLESLSQGSKVGEKILLGTHEESKHEVRSYKETSVIHQTQVLNILVHVYNRVYT